MGESASAPAFGVFIVLAVLITLAVTVYLLRLYTSWSTTRLYTYVTLILGWSLSFSVVLLLPLDVESAQDCGSDDTCDTDRVHNSLITIWNIEYWVTFSTTWFIVPFLQLYTVSGEFSFPRRLVGAIRGNLIYYLALTVLYLLFLVWQVAAGAVTWENAEGFTIALSNAYGLMLLVLLLGYGLVEIPRGLWLAGQHERNLRHLEFQAVVVRDNLDAAQLDLRRTLSRIKYVDERTLIFNDLRPYVATICDKCPPEYASARSRAADWDGEITYASIVALHAELLDVIVRINRAQRQWEHHLQLAWHLEDVVNSAHENVTRMFNTTLRSPSARPSARWKLKAQWLWYVQVQPIAYRVLAVLCGLLSVMIIWSEMMFSVRSPNLSLLAELVAASRTSSARTFLVFTPVLYIAVCAYFSLFRLKLYNYYQLVPHQHNDNYSLLFNSAYLSRLVIPLGYNFVLMAKIEDTAFQSVIGQLEIIPLLGTTFNVYIPILIAVFCLATATNVYSRVARRLGLRRLDFNDISDEHERDILRGKELISKARLYAERDAVRSQRIQDLIDTPRGERDSLLASEKGTSARDSARWKLFGGTTGTSHSKTEPMPRSAPQRRDDVRVGTSLNLPADSLYAIPIMTLEDDEDK